jgi:hypothetical protein
MIRTGIIYLMIDSIINHIFDSIDSKLNVHFSTESEHALVIRLTELINTEIKYAGAMTDAFKLSYYPIRMKLMGWWSGIDAPIPGDSTVRNHGKTMVRQIDRIIDRVNMIQLQSNPAFTEIHNVAHDIESTK